MSLSFRCELHRLFFFSALLLEKSQSEDEHLKGARAHIHMPLTAQGFWGEEGEQEVMLGKW